MDGVDCTFTRPSVNRNYNADARGEAVRTMPRTLACCPLHSGVQGRHQGGDLSPGHDNRKWGDGGGRSSGRGSLSWRPVAGVFCAIVTCKERHKGTGDLVVLPVRVGSRWQLAAGCGLLTSMGQQPILVAKLLVVGC